MRVTSRHTALMSCAISGALAVGWMSAPRLGAQALEVSSSAIYANYCATCHGTSGKGDGPLASSMKKRPPDLTQIAKRNGGVFAAEQVARTIDGRSPVKGHGGGDMPVWGNAFAKSGADAMPVEQKIQRLVSYLESIQVKP